MLRARPLACPGHGGIAAVGCVLGRAALPAVTALRDGDRGSMTRATGPAAVGLAYSSLRFGRNVLAHQRTCPLKADSVVRLHSFVQSRVW